MWKCFALAISNLSPLCSTMLFAVMFSQFLAREYVQDTLVNKHAFETVHLCASDLGMNNSYRVTPGNFFNIAIATNPQLFSKFRNV